MEPDDAWPCCPCSLSLFLISVERNGVLGELAHNSLLSCYFPTWPVVLITPFVSHLGALCFALQWLSCCTHWRTCKSRAAQQGMGLETLVEHPQLSPPTSPGRPAEHKPLWGSLDIFLFFISLFTQVLWSVLVLGNYFHLQPCYWAIAVIPESSLAHQELGSLTDL